MEAIFVLSSTMVLQFLNSLP